MHAVRGSILRAAALVVALAPSTILAQAQPQGAPANPNAGMLTPSTTNAAAVTELRTAIEDYFTWSWKSGAQHASRALQLEPTFGLARTWGAFYLGGPTAAAEFQRAVTEASTASAGEVLLALAQRELSGGRAPAGRRIQQAAFELMPNDRTVALWRAASLLDTARINALREVSNKYPDYIGSRVFLAFYLAPTGIVVDSVAKANAGEALRVAGEAVRLAPQTAGSHTAMGHVLHALARDTEAQQHLLAAASMTPKSWYTYDLLSDIYAREGRIAEQRSALDSAIAWAPGIGQTSNARRIRAATFVSEGNVQQAMADLAQLVKELETINARGQLATTHLWMAIMAAGTRDSAGAEQHVTAAKVYEPAAGALADNGVIVYSLIGNATQARAALNDYIRIANEAQNLSPQAQMVRTQNIHRQTGLVLVAERKAQEAIAELRQGGPNPYATLGIIEAHKQMKNNKQADAERTAFFARKQLTAASSATPIIRYRAKK